MREVSETADDSRLAYGQLCLLRVYSPLGRIGVPDLYSIVHEVSIINVLH